MKIHLRTSPLKEDYGIMSLYNAFFYLLEKEDILDIWLEEIMRFYLHKRENRERKTLEKWFYEKEMDVPIMAQFINGRDVEEEYMQKIIREKGCIVTSIYQKKHYILVTKIDNSFVYVFDPYIEVEGDSYNRKIDKNIFFHGLEKEGSLGPVRERLCLGLTKKIKIFDYEKNEGGI